MTDLLTEHAIRFLEKPRDRPFMLCVWHKAVHGPFTPAPRHQNLYADVSMAEPVSHRDTFEGKPAWQRRQPEPWDPHLPNRINYYRAEVAVDDSVGRVLDMLEKSSQLDNTYVIFTSDNGFFHGEHRRSDKRAAYEESIRIPFVMSGPAIAKTPRLIDQMVLNIDFAPTILELAGVKPAPTMQGRSFKPLLRAESPSWRSSFLYEYFQEKQINRIPTMVGVRTLEWKYVMYPTLDDVDEIYDLRKDPHEMRNLFADPAAGEKLKELKAELARLKKETGYQEPTGGHP
jgi:arylsulfatase A-like enzyme